MFGPVIVLYSPNWNNTVFSFILPTINLFRHPLTLFLLQDLVFGSCFVVHCFVYLLVLQSSRWEERAGCVILWNSECHI